MTCHELDRAIENEGLAFNNDGVDHVDRILAGMLVNDAIAELGVIDTGELADQLADELDLAVAHDPAEALQDSLGVALAGIASRLPEIGNGAAGRHNDIDLALDRKNV